MSGKKKARRKVKNDWNKHKEFWINQELKLIGEIMTIKELASKVAKAEGKKTQVKIGDVREVLGILSDMTYDETIDVHNILYKNGKARAKKTAK